MTASGAITRRECSSRCANVALITSAPVAGSSSELCAAEKCESGRGRVGINTHPTSMVAAVNPTTSPIAAGDQMVEVSGMSPVVGSRKCPGVAINSGALAENPNCQIEPAPARVASRKRKSMAIPLRSASRAK